MPSMPETGGKSLTNKGFSGCSRSRKCGMCTGDCDSNADCASGLSCFQRNDKHTVPGCKSGGSGDVNTYDYCTSGTPATSTLSPEF